MNRDRDISFKSSAGRCDIKQNKQTEAPKRTKTNEKQSRNKPEKKKREKKKEEKNTSPLLGITEITRPKRIRLHIPIPDAYPQEQKLSLIYILNKLGL